MTIKITTTINAPVERTWQVLSNPDYLCKWLEGFISIEPLDGRIGESGSTNRMKFLERGRQIEVIERIVLVVPCVQHTIRLEGDGFDSLSDIRLIPLGKRTEIIQAVQLFPKGFFFRLAVPLLKGTLKKRMMRDLQNLKKLTETGDASIIV